MSSRRKFMQTTALAGLGMSMIHSNLFAGIMNQEIPYKMTPLRNNVGFFTEKGGTIGWMISKDGLVVVDTQFPEQAQHLIEAIKKQSGRQQIDLLINTHHHGDHTGGNIAFKGLMGKLLAHENSKKNQMRVAEANNTSAAQLYPDTLFAKEWSGKVGEEILSLKYFGAAHTDGDALVHFENANIVHMGDLVFNRRYPYIDKTAGASVKNWIEVLEQAQKVYDKDTKFIFGHADNGFEVVGTKDDIRAFQAYLSRLLEEVGAAIKAGKTQDEIMKIQAIKGADEWKGDGISRSLSAAYEELKPK